VPYVEQVGAAALINSDPSCIRDAVDAYRIRRDVCMNAVEDMNGVSCKKPQGAFYFILSLPIEDAEDFTGWLLSDFEVNGETIMLCPASESYATPNVGKNEVRISYCINENELKKAMIF
jgi:aspartate aminotransferase